MRVIFQRIAIIATVLALFVVILGAYVRLSHAGLGCPDWPGCYGHRDVPTGEREIAQALRLPLPVAVAHNGVAVLLLLALMTLNYVLRARKIR